LSLKITIILAFIVLRKQTDASAESAYPVSMISLALLFVSGVWLLQQQAVLPDMQLAWWLLSIIPVLSVPLRLRWLRIVQQILLLVFALCSGFFYAAGIAQHRLADELASTWQGRDISLTGVVA
jgi:competence protein ComEC